MEPASLAFGTITAKLVLRLWLGDSAFESAAESMADLVKSRVTDYGERGKAIRLLDQVQDGVARRVSGYMEYEFRDVQENERLSAVNTATLVLSNALTDERTPYAVDLDATRLEQVFQRNGLEEVRRAGLSSGAEAFYDLLIREASKAIIGVVDRFPHFHKNSNAEILKRESELSAAVEEVMDTLSAPSVPHTWGEGSEDDRYEQKLTAVLAENADVVTLFGVDLPITRRPYSLSVAYVSLTTAQVQADSAVEDDGHVGDGDEDDSETEHIVRVEAAIGENDRTLVAGAAGSGKTTLLQWLTVTACRGAFAGDLINWNGLVPFFLPLRAFVKGQFPRPEEFLLESAPNLIGVMPTGWVHRILEAGRGLLLIDGLDELPESQRPAARVWLNELIALFPRSKYIVTSRPLAISDDWRDLPDFKQTELLEMQIQDIRAFVSHWHAAARYATADATEADALRQTERELLASLRDQKAIRTLCTSPLLCALICALHRDHMNKLPESRMELYETALKMLLAQRDSQRDVETDEDDVRLSVSEKLILLQDIGLWMHENGVSDCEEAIYFGRIEAKLPNLPHVSGSSMAIGKQLLVRSGVLRKPVEDRVAFVHRTFLEFLAAAALVENEDIPKLILHAHIDTWRDVIVLAAGHAGLRQRHKLIEGLIGRGDQEPLARHRLYLLAVACMETSPQLDVALVTRLAICLEQIVPPNNMTEAAQVASAGGLAVPQLVKHKRLAVQAAACIRSLAMIGSEEALEALETFGSDDRLTVVRQLVRAWPQYDPERYARTVLARSPLEKGRVAVFDPDLVPHLSLLANLTEATLDVPGRVDNLAEVAGHEAIVEVDVSQAASMTDLWSVRRFPKLRRLVIQNSTSLRSLRGIESAEYLTDFSCEGSKFLWDASALSPLRHLSRVNLSATGISTLKHIGDIEMDVLEVLSCRKLVDLGPIVNSTSLFLSSGVLEDTAGITAATRLRSLYFYAVGDTDIELSLSESLRSLTLRFAPRVGLRGGAGVREIDFSGSRSSDWVEVMLGLPGVVTGTLRAHPNRIGGLHRLEDHPALTSLRVASVGAETMSDPPAIPSFTVVQRSRWGVTYERDAVESASA